MRHDPPTRRSPDQDAPSAFEVVSRLVGALAARDEDTLRSLRTEDHVVDWVHRDAFSGPPMSPEESAAFHPTWFAGFDDVDYEVTRTIAGDEVVVTEWVFTGTHTGPLLPPVFDRRLEPTGRTIRFRGATIYEVRGGLVTRETTYMDLATLLVELGATL